MTALTTLPMVRFRPHHLAGSAGVKRLMLAILKLLGLRPRPPGPARTRKAAPGEGRRVWRITDEHPQGTWVDAEARPSRPRDSSAPAPFDSWTTSSMDLRDGVQIVEDEVHGPQDPRPH
jgi:hypothetical protein